MKRTCKRGFLLLIPVIALVLALSACAGSVSALERTKSGDERVVHILFMGRDRAAGLCDSIMLITVREAVGAVSVLQIPRDTYAEYTERDYKKLNGLLNAEGEKGSVSFLSEALGVPIDYFAVLDLDALRTLVDAVGGVDVTVEHEMRYTDPAGELEIQLSAGTHHLDGRGAENFVRYRSGYANADLGRLDAQKQFIRAFAARMWALAPMEKAKVTAALVTSLSTDMDVGTMWRLMGLFKTSAVDRLTLETLCGQAVLGNSGASYYVLNRAGAYRQIKACMLPNIEFDEQAFDPQGLFDREDHPGFHRIYTAPEEALSGA